jgi:hypothetical protein
MTRTRKKVAWIAKDPPGRSTSAYPPQLRARIAGRFKRPPGDLFGLANFGATPGASPARPANLIEAGGAA